MKPLTCILVLTSAWHVVAAITQTAPTRPDRSHQHTHPVHDDDDNAPHLEEGDTTPQCMDREIDCDKADALLPRHDEANATGLLPQQIPMPRFMKIGYGTQWKKGINHWVAFPMLGLMACKSFVVLGPKMVGPKHGACQKSFSIAGKWYQLNGCNPTTGMPKFLLDGDGYTIKSCKARSFKILCLKEGKISGRGSCEDPPPDESGLFLDNDEGGMTGLY